MAESCLTPLALLGRRVITKEGVEKMSRESVLTGQSALA